jgi:hypothetical protein
MRLLPQAGSAVVLVVALLNTASPAVSAERRDKKVVLDDEEFTNLIMAVVTGHGGVVVQERSMSALFEKRHDAVAACSDSVKNHVNWAVGNTGAPDCPHLYAATYPECLWNGRNRACLMEKAIASAKANDCENAFRLTLITQCHNGAAASEIASCGKQGVCEYLRTK